MEAKLITTILTFIEWGKLLAPFMVFGALVCLIPIPTKKGYRALVTRIHKGIFD